MDTLRVKTYDCVKYEAGIHDFVHCSAGYQCLVYSLALHCLRFHKFIVQSHIYCFAFCRLNFLLWLDLNLNSQWPPSGSRPMIV